MHRGAVIGLGVVGVLLVASQGIVPGASGAPANPSTMALFSSHIDHIVFLMQENHPFDNLYGNYCPTTGSYCRYTADGIPAGTCVPKNLTYPKGYCFRPFNFTATNLSPPIDLPHNWSTTHQSWDNGKMDGFFQAEWNTPETFGHYNATTVPVYWDIAEQYGLADDFFSPVGSYSSPNHWYMLSSTAPAVTYQNLISSSKTTWQTRTTYLNESNRTRSIEDRLANSTVSWAYYQNTLVPYNQAIAPAPLARAYDYWSPLAGRAQSYRAPALSHFENRSQFFTDAANGQLPNLSWVIPAGQNSDHPSFNITAGQSWVASVVDAIERSPEWNSTVLFISWDEYGGFYDHVAPPQLDAYGDGFRVPLLAVGPWVKQGYIDHGQMDFDSVLHLMEKRFGLACIGTRDCQAKLPLAMFNFSRTPRAPIQILPYGTATYPMPLQSSGRLPPYLGPGPRYVEPPPPEVPGGFNWS